MFSAQEARNIWVENRAIFCGWRLTSEHVLTGIPENDWKLDLQPGLCLDLVPIRQEEICIRPYGFDDTFAGPLGELSTHWFGRPAVEWFAVRRLDLKTCGLDPLVDVQFAPLFPILPASKVDPAFIQWLVSSAPKRNTSFEQQWRTVLRLSAFQITTQVNLTRLFEQRHRWCRASLLPMRTNFRRSAFFRLDLEATARTFAAGDQLVPELSFTEQDDPMHLVHDRMFQAAMLRYQGNPDWPRFEAQAFAQLRQVIVGESRLPACIPRRMILNDQIAWGRSPVRFDLAGGWTDTPPYCIEHGGTVVNLAADLNGQPPIQVFAKLSTRPELLLRSIDLGLEERIKTYEELERFDRPEDPFALAKAAIALVGFLPRFHATGCFRTLEEQLLDFGGGLELSLLSAVPKGSGLGTSSILAATTLATLAEVCGLNWDRAMLFNCTLVLEQLLTTGGGWQDQAGAMYGGVKVVQTVPGFAQVPMLRWLPGNLFSQEYANRSTLLYYTGLTRMAKNILAEVVRGVFLNSPTCLRAIDEIGANAQRASAAIQTCDYSRLMEAIRNSWSLNQRLDAGTNPPAVQQILDSVGDYLGAAKLLGAGGGGYLLLFAKDETAAGRIRQKLLQQPPNACARFVQFSLSETGLRVSKS